MCIYFVAFSDILNVDDIMHGLCTKNIDIKNDKATAPVVSVYDCEKCQDNTEIEGIKVDVFCKTPTYTFPENIRGIFESGDEIMNYLCQRAWTIDEETFLPAFIVLGCTPNWGHITIEAKADMFGVRWTHEHARWSYVLALLDILSYYTEDMTKIEEARKIVEQLMANCKTLADVEQYVLQNEDIRYKLKNIVINNLLPDKDEPKFSAFRIRFMS